MNPSSLRRYTLSHDHKLCPHVHTLTRSKTQFTLHILTQSQILSTLAHFDTIPNSILTYTDSHDFKLCPPVHTLPRFLILSTCTNSYVILKHCPHKYQLNDSKTFPHVHKLTQSNKLSPHEQKLPRFPTSVNT